MNRNNQFREQSSVSLQMMRQNYVVIREIFDNQYYASEFLEQHLEKALRSGVQYVVIEPELLAAHTQKWIEAGNILNKSALVSGIGTLVAPSLLPKHYQVCVMVPLVGANLICTMLYNLTWKDDPCSKYQAEENTDQTLHLQLKANTTNTALVLCRQNDKHRRRLQKAVACLVVVSASLKLYEYFKG